MYQDCNTLAQNGKQDKTGITVFSILGFKYLGKWGFGDFALKLIGVFPRIIP